MVNLRFFPSTLSSKVKYFRRCGGRGPTPLARSSVQVLQRLKSSSVEEIMACLPFYTQGEIVKGFGRGSKELGIPTGEFYDKRRSAKLLSDGQQYFSEIQCSYSIRKYAFMGFMIFMFVISGAFKMFCMICLQLLRCFCAVGLEHRLFHI